MSETATHPQNASETAATPLPIWKRSLDLVLAFFGILLLAPLMVAIAIFIKIASPGPALYRQERVGFRGQRFYCLKFRSMRVNADTSPHAMHLSEIIEKKLPLHKLDGKGDGRLIPFGWLLRASGMDELPQLINILQGTMSFVGPRPCVPFEYKFFSDDQKKRFEAVPGLTGLWQVMGKNDTTFDRMVELDIQYARNRSLSLDLKIIALTIPTLINQVLRLRPSKAHGRIDS